MPKIILHSLDASPPCRAVLMVADILGVPLQVQETSLFDKDNLTDDYLKKNPQHTVPTLEDDDFVVWDSHAIMGYLVTKYAKDDSLYPKEPRKRAKIDQYLHFETGVLFNVAKSIFKPVLYFGDKIIPQEKMDSLKEAYGFLDKFLEGKKWLVGGTCTIADISCISTVTSLLVIKDVDDYPNVKAWVKTCEEEIPGYKKLNVPGLTNLHTLLRAVLQ